jgi:hypothetical protein
MKMKELVSSIQSLLVKVEDGNLTQAEMEQLVADARELNERLIVLRYKVYEQGIFEVEPIVTQELEVELPEIELNLEFNEEPQESNLNEAIESQNPDEFKKDHALSEVMNTMLDDLSKEDLESIFDTNQVSFEPTIDNPSDSDLFSSEAPTEELSMELNFEDENDEEEYVIEESTLITTTFDDEYKSETQKITHHQTSVIETEDSLKIIETEESTTITLVENSVKENEGLLVNVTSEIEPPLTSESQNSSSNSETEGKLKLIEQSLRINYSIVPLETLIGSFTLNERLQFINELFEGSSDSFSSAVKKLDVLDGLDAARNVVGEFALSNDWDLESEIVEDFLVKICRRYA